MKRKNGFSLCLLTYLGLRAERRADEPSRTCKHRSTEADQVTGKCLTMKSAAHKSQQILQFWSKYTTRSHLGSHYKQWHLEQHQARCEHSAKTLGTVYSSSHTGWESNRRGQRGTWWASKGVDILYLKKTASQKAPHLFILHIQLYESSWNRWCSAGPAVCFSKL